MAFQAILGSLVSKLGSGIASGLTSGGGGGGGIGGGNKTQNGKIAGNWMDRSKKYQNKWGRDNGKK